MAINTQCNATVVKQDSFLEECKMMSPQLLVGTLPTVPALPIRRILRIELDLVNQLARLAHDPGAVCVSTMPRWT
eukprot:3609152-Prorocentrum_lima.AAC.1